MESLPHYYLTRAEGGPAGAVHVTAEDRPSLETAPPPEFGGPSGVWSPEHLLAASIADCFVLSFRAVARASRLEWSALTCEVEAVLDRGAERKPCFTEFRVRPVLTLEGEADETKAGRCLEKAKVNCLITNSLSGTVHLEPRVKMAGAARA